VLAAHGLGVAEASTLGWAQTVTTVFTEIRNIGFVCFFGALVIAGIELIFHRHLERIGQVIAAIGVGGGLIGGASAAAASILGGAAAAAVSSVAHGLTYGEVFGDIFAFNGLYLGWMLSVFLSCYLWVSRHARAHHH